MSGRSPDCRRGQQLGWIGLKTLKEEKGFATVNKKGIKITYDLDWIAQITITRINIDWIAQKAREVK